MSTAQQTIHTQQIDQALDTIGDILEHVDTVARRLDVPRKVLESDLVFTRGILDEARRSQ